MEQITNEQELREQIKNQAREIKLLKQSILVLNSNVRDLALYVANTPCCTPDKYASLICYESGAIGIAEPDFMRQARRNTNGFDRTFCSNCSKSGVISVTDIYETGKSGTNGNGFAR